MANKWYNKGARRGEITRFGETVLKKGKCWEGRFHYKQILPSSLWIQFRILLAKN